MFCRRCGHEVNDDAIICPNCGVTINGHGSVGSQRTKGDEFQSQPNNQYNPMRNQCPVARTNGFGIAGFVLSLLSIYLGLYMCIMSILAFVFSLIGTVKSKEYTSCNGLAIAGLVISIITTVFWLFMWIIFVIVLGGTLI